jgi:adenylate cyclase
MSAPVLAGKHTIFCTSPVEFSAAPATSRVDKSANRMLRFFFAPHRAGGILEQHRTERRLAAILAADMVGYSRLTGQDEEGTLARLSALRRDLIDPVMSEHRGRLVKTTGDGLLVEFASVVDAVRCALRIQQGTAILNIDVRSEKRIEFRIGINLGDVVVDGDDLLGDGVNIAARLERLAEPGAICVSEDAYRQIRAKIDVTVQDLGEQRLKNISEPVRVYALRAPAATAPRVSSDQPVKPRRPQLSFGLRLS